MAALEGDLTKQLFMELKEKYPEFPENILVSKMKEYCNNKEKCMEALNRESPKYLYGQNNPLNQFHELQISGNRNESAFSNTNAEFYGSNAKRPVSNSPKQIPNINCSVYQQSNLSNQLSSPVQQIEVQHITSKPEVHDGHNVSSTYSQTPAFSRYQGNTAFNHLDSSRTRPRPNVFNSAMQPNWPHHLLQSSQHSAHAEIYLDSTSPNQSTFYINPLVIDQHQNVSHSNISPPCHPSQNMGSPFPNSKQNTQPHNSSRVVELTSLGPDSVQSQVRYLPVYKPMDHAPQSNLLPNSTRSVYSTMIHSDGKSAYSNNSNTVQNTSAVVHLPPSRSTVTSIASRSCPSRSSSMDSDQGNVIMIQEHDGQVNQHPGISPASSHSSLSSSDSSQRERQQSSAVQEDVAYTKALISHQQARYNKLNNIHDAECRKLQQLRDDVRQMEKELFLRRSHRSSSFPSADDVAKLRESNRKLQIDVQFMTREIDMYNNGQTPLGVIDPVEQQNFFKNMNTGQRGSIWARPPTPQENTIPPPLPPRISHVPPPPPKPTAGDPEGEGDNWSCSACTFLNHPALDKCECCEMPRIIRGS